LTNLPVVVLWSKKIDNQPTSDGRVIHKASTAKKPGSCFQCGKLGYYSKECRSRHAQERSQQQPTVFPTPVVKTKSTDSGNTGRVKREITCFNCRQKGHISPQCPLRQNQVKRIETPSDKVVELKQNELFGAIGEHRLPITCHTGVNVTLVPEEYVSDSQLTGETCRHCLNATS